MGYLFLLKQLPVAANHFNYLSTYCHSKSYWRWKLLFVWVLFKSVSGSLVHHLIICSSHFSSTLLFVFLYFGYVIDFDKVILITFTHFTTNSCFWLCQSEVFAVAFALLAAGAVILTLNVLLLVISSLSLLSNHILSITSYLVCWQCLHSSLLLQNFRVDTLFSSRV